MANKLYGYWLDESKIWFSHSNSRCERTGFKTLDEAKKSLRIRYDEINDSDNTFVVDFGLFEYEIDAPPGIYTQIYRIRNQ